MGRAQVSFEYLTIIALLILISAVVLIYSSVIFANKEGSKEAISAYAKKVPDMLGMP